VGIRGGFIDDPEANAWAFFPCCHGLVHLQTYVDCLYKDEAGSSWLCLRFPMTNPYRPQQEVKRGGVHRNGIGY
jgi:hypothetical protein